MAWSRKWSCLLGEGTSHQGVCIGSVVCSLFQTNNTADSSTSVMYNVIYSCNPVFLPSRPWVGALPPHRAESAGRFVYSVSCIVDILLLLGPKLSSTALSILPTSLIPPCTHDLQHETARTHLWIYWGIQWMNATTGVCPYTSHGWSSPLHHVFLLQQRYHQPLRASLHFRFLTDPVSRRLSNICRKFLTLFHLWTTRHWIDTHGLTAFARRRIRVVSRIR